MLDKLTKTITRFFGIIAGSLSGLGAILTAIGYLAERSHLKMLGFTGIPVDLNQYLYSGAFFLAHLPNLLVLIASTLLFNGWVLFLAGLIVLAVWASTRLTSVAYLHQRITAFLRGFFGQHRVAILVIFLVVQLMSLSWLTQATDVKNILFDSEISATAERVSFFKTGVDDLRSWIFYDRTESLRQYFFTLVLFVALSAVILRYLVSSYRKQESSQVLRFQAFWLSINLILFILQTILIPINFGALLLQKSYTEVKVRFIGTDEEEAVLSDGALLRNSAPRTTATIRPQTLALDEEPFRRNLADSPCIFEDPDGDLLDYSARSEDPHVARAEIVGSVLQVSAVDPGQTHVVVSARDPKGMMDSTRVAIEVAVIDNLAPERNSDIPQQMLSVGSMFTSELSELFTDPDNHVMSYTAHSDAPHVARVTVEGNKLMVKAYTGGTAKISVMANDGMGMNSFPVSFDVVAIEQTLQWPPDNRLVLIHKTDDVFYLYSRQQKRIWHIRSADIHSLVYYGQTDLFGDKQ